MEFSEIRKRMEVKEQKIKITTSEKMTFEDRVYTVVKAEETNIFGGKRHQIVAVQNKKVIGDIGFTFLIEESETCDTRIATTTLTKTELEDFMKIVVAMHKRIMDE